MNKNQKIYIVGIIAVIIFAIGLSVYFLFRSPANNNGGSTGNTGNNNQSNVVSLPPGEEEKIKQFVVLFVDLYNSYGYDDYKSAINEATYGTPDFQQKTIDKFNDIQAITKEGYNLVTKSDINSFQVLVYKNNRVTVSVKGVEVETQNNQTIDYNFIATVSFVNTNNQWVVTDCVIAKQ
jgi:hypothetical protein